MTYPPHDFGPADPTLPATPTLETAKSEIPYTDQQDRPTHAILWPPNCMISFEEPETPPPVVPKGYMVLTEQQHYDLTQQAAKAKAEALFCTLTDKAKTDHHQTTATLALVMDEIEQAGAGLAEIRRLRTEAERTARNRRQIGRLATQADIRRELADLYRETYAGDPEDGRHFTRMAYMLDCLARLAAKDPKPRKKAGQSVDE